jgi:hypothetical protein
VAPAARNEGTQQSQSHESAKSLNTLSHFHCSVRHTNRKLVLFAPLCSLCCPTGPTTQRAHQPLHFCSLACSSYPHHAFLPFPFFSSFKSACFGQVSKSVEQSEVAKTCVYVLYVRVSPWQAPLPNLLCLRPSLFFLSQLVERRALYLEAQGSSPACSTSHIISCLLPAICDLK